MSHPPSSHIGVSARAWGKCPVCGRRTLRTATFYSSRTADRSAADAVRAASAEADAWIPDHTHLKCKGTI